MTSKPTLNIINKSVIREPRAYLGASEIGDACPRKIFYSFRWWQPEFIETRLNDIFQMGHIIEEMILNKFREDPSFEVKQMDENNERFHFETPNGLIKGHLDAIIKGFKECADEYVVVDIKSFNQARFLAWQRKGTKASNPKYYTQLTLYAGAYGIKKCCVFGMNKNTCEMDYEIFDFDQEHFDEKIDLAIEIIESKFIPNRAFVFSDGFQCNMCNYKEICWHLKPYEPVKHCRTCKNFHVLDKNIICQLKGHELSLELQKQGCENHELLQDC